jgi:hydrogenase/urease accessory protein HupE
MRLVKFFIVVLALQVSSFAWAHLGNEHSMSLLQGVLHFFSEPVHLLYLTIIFLIGALLIRITLSWTRQVRCKK